MGREVKNIFRQHKMTLQRGVRWAVAYIFLFSVSLLPLSRAFAAQQDVCPAGTVLNLILGAFVLEEVGEPADLVANTLSQNPPYAVLSSEVVVTGTEVMRTTARITALRALNGVGAGLTLAANVQVKLQFLVYPALPPGVLSNVATTCTLLLGDMLLGDCKSLNNIVQSAAVQAADDPATSLLVFTLSANNLVALFNDSNIIAPTAGAGCEVCALDSLVREWINGGIKYKLLLEIGKRFISYDSRTMKNTVL